MAAATYTELSHLANNSYAPTSITSLSQNQCLMSNHIRGNIGQHSSVHTGSSHDTRRITSYGSHDSSEASDVDLDHDLLSSDAVNDGDLGRKYIHSCNRYTKLSRLTRPPQSPVQQWRLPIKSISPSLCLCESIAIPLAVKHANTDNPTAPPTRFCIVQLSAPYLLPEQGRSGQGSPRTSTPGSPRRFLRLPAQHDITDAPGSSLRRPYGH